jgi:tetratricopeptide (TPR) repeat protein
MKADHISEIPEERGGDRPRLTPVRRHFGISAFGVNIWKAAEPGKHVIQPHTETNPSTLRHEELFFVLSGHARFEIEGETVDAPQGTFVFVRDPAARREAIALDDDTTILALGGEPGEPYAVGPWEWTYRAILAFHRGDDEEAGAILSEGLQHHPRSPRIHYNLACYYARRGDRERAFEHLATAVEIEPETKMRAPSDPDFAELLDDPRFPH